MILIGNDIVEVKKIKKLISKYGVKFLNKIFTKEEQEFCKQRMDSSIHFSGRFAAKEAVKKVLLQINNSQIPLKEIEIKRKINSPPRVYVRNIFKKEIIISISHTKKYATAVAILDRR